MIALKLTTAADRVMREHSDVLRELAK